MVKSIYLNCTDNFVCTQSSEISSNLVNMVWIFLMSVSSFGIVANHLR